MVHGEETNESVDISTSQIAVIILVPPSNRKKIKARETCHMVDFASVREPEPRVLIYDACMCALYKDALQDASSQ